MLEKGHSVNKQDSNGCTAIHHAAKNGHLGEKQSVCFAPLKVRYSRKVWYDQKIIKCDLPTKGTQRSSMSTWEGITMSEDVIINPIALCNTCPLCIHIYLTIHCCLQSLVICDLNVSDFGRRVDRFIAGKKAFWST